VINCRDIHASKVADQALLQAEQRLTLLLNNTKESFILLNNRLRVVAYNRAAQEHSPYFLGAELRSDVSFSELVGQAEKDEYLQVFENVLQGRERERFTSYTDEAGNLHIYQHTFRSLDLQGAKGVFITSTDITEKRKAELALKENEERFRTLIEYSFDAILIIDTVGNIQYASPSIQNLLGYEPEEVVGRNGFEFIWHEDIPGVQAKLASIVQNVDETYADYRSTTSFGGLKWIEAKGKNMFHNPYINGILLSLRDISDRKKLEEEQSELTDELVKYNKDLQQFSFITSHNLRAPVANLMSLLSLYNNDNTADPFNAELMPKFRECADQLNDTLNDLINVLVIRSKAGADIEFVRFDDMVELVKRNVGALLREANGTIETDFTSVEGLSYNKVHMESIFLNLLTNAIKYSDPSRPLKVEVRSEDVEGWVTLYFTDNGIGIDLERYSDRIFGLYQRFNASKDGKGLGLYMIKSQVMASGGKIEVQSKPGEGTTFIVSFRKRD
jgi:PAS domain S-box-containing protein